MRRLLFLLIPMILLLGISVELIEAQSCSVRDNAFFFGQTSNDYGYTPLTGMLKSYFPDANTATDKTIVTFRDANGFNMTAITCDAVNSTNCRAVAISKTFTTPYTLCGLRVEGKPHSGGNFFKIPTRQLKAYVKLQGQSTWTPIGLDSNSNNYNIEEIDYVPETPLVITGIAVYGITYIVSGATTQYAIYKVDANPTVLEEPDERRPLLVTDELPEKLFDLNFTDAITIPNWLGGLSSAVTDFFSWTTTALNWFGILSETDTPKRPALYLHNSNIWRLPSNDPGDAVYSITGGTVTNIQPFLPWCGQVLYNDLDKACSLELPPAYTQLNFTAFVQLNTLNASIVTVTSDSGYDYHYIVDRATVQEGKEVTEDCIIGYTMQTAPLDETFDQIVREDIISSFDLDSTASALDYALDEMLNRDSNPSETWQGMAFVAKTTVGEMPWDEMAIKIEFGAEYPVPGARCDTDPMFSGCLNFNPQFKNDGEFWETLSGTPSYTNDSFGGVVLPGGAGVYMVLPLNASIQYSVSIKASAISATGAILRVQLGTDADDFTLDQPPNFAQYFTMPTETRTPDAGSYFTFSIQNRSSQAAKVVFACVKDGAPDTLNDTGCYFVNSSFEDGLENWTATGSVTVGNNNPFAGPLSQPNGTIRMQDGSTIAQQVKLYPNEDATSHIYTAYIQYELTAATGQVAKFEYAYGGSYEDWGSTLSVTVDTSQVGPLQLGTATENITVSALKDTTMTIRASIKDGSNAPIAGQYITVHRVCIKGPYPQQGYDDGTVDPFPENCDLIQVPSNTNVSNMVAWHWYNTNRFNQCELMPLLNDMYALANEAFTFSTRQFQWEMWNSFKFTKWLGDKAMPWLGGYLANIQPGQIVVQQSGCSDLFCLLNNLVSTLGGLLNSIINAVIAPILNLLLQIVGAAANILFGVITALITLALSLIGQILSWLKFVFDLFTTFITAWTTSAPTPIPGVPTCSGATPHGICTFWDALGVTFFSGSGALIVPLLTGIISIRIFLRLFSQVRGMILKAGQAS